MTRKRVTASEKKQRHEWAVRQIDAGMGLSELTAFTAETWGCSGRQARARHTLEITVLVMAAGGRHRVGTGNGGIAPAAQRHCADPF